MKNLKKMLSVFVVIAMLATTMLPAFAAETAAPKTEAEIASGLGVVKGGTEGVTDAYLKASTQRYQAAIIYLRLLGLEETAKVFAGKENFADAKVLNTDMQKYLAYLKANPQHGWLGIGGNKFDPMSVTSAQAFYKVLLESLGYKCTVGNVKGDFDYNNTIAFAAEKGLTKVASVSKFTNADLISAVLEALAVEKKDTGKTLLKTLVDAKVIAEDVAKQYLPEALEVKKDVTTAVYSVAAANGELKVVLTEDVGTKPADADFTVTQAINGAAATTVTGSVYEYTYTTKTVVIKVPAVAETSAEQNVVYSVKYKDTTAVAAPAVVVGASFGIKEVVEPSLKLIKVNLNKDYDSAKDTFTVYKTSDTAATVAVTAKAVAGNAKQVLIIATGTFEADVDYTVKVTRDSKDYTKTFKVAADTSVPQIAKAEAIGNKTIRVKFSEPVQNAGAGSVAANVITYNYKIGDFAITGSDDATVVNDSPSIKAVAKKVGSTTVDDVVVSDDLTTVDFTLKSALATGEYTLAMVKSGTNVKDYAGYEVPLTSAKFTVVLSDKVAQADKITVNSRSEVAIDFTGAISAPALSNIFWNTDGVDTNSSKQASAVSKTSDTKYTFSFTSNVVPTGKVYFFVKGVVDAYGNAVPTKKFEVTVGTDAVATATVTVENENTVKVKFSKDMQATLTAGVETNSGTAGNAGNKTHYTIKKADGTAVEITEAKYVAADKTTILTLKDKQSGACTISVSGVKDLVGQEVQAISAQSITFTDVTAPTVTSVSVVAGSNKIYVIFSEAMATSGSYSVLNVANYKWKNAAGPAVSSYSDLPSGTTIALSAEDSKAIVITLPTDTTTAAATTKLQFGYISGSAIKAVSDTAGNVLLIGTEGTAVAVADGATTIAAQELKITAGNTLRVKLSGTRLKTVSYSDFEYTVDNFVTPVTPSSAKLVEIDGAQYIEFTTNSDAFNSNTDLTKVKVRTIVAPSTSTATSVGTKIAGSATSAAASTTSFTTSIKSVAIYDNATVIVKLDGNIKAADLAAFSASVKLYQGTTLIPITGEALVGSITQSSIIKLTTASNAIDVTGSVVLKTLPVAFITSKDANGQYLVANTDGKTGTSAFIAGSLARSIAGIANVTTGDTVTINFSMVPKDVPATGTVEADGTGVKITIANVGTITGFTSADNTTLTGAAASVAVNGTSIVVTLTQAGTQANFAFPAGNLLTFTPNSALANTASSAIDTEVKPIK
ncbi:MAG TPA: hypothetical protein VIO64_21365 [Pseudobacteroides sp.]|uniref:hypothetical protein n=1 Tax=Pseudobacteroides sp. TaxID=1968840 RepID=UPI002F944D87